MSQQIKYTEEFKAEAVKLVTQHGYTVIKASQHLGIGKSTLGMWLKRHRAMKEGTLNETDQAKLRRLEKENRELKMERDILKEAAVYFAVESKKSTRS